MAFTGKVLADGQLQSSLTTLYTVPASTVSFVKYFTLFNTSATTQTITVYLNVSGTNRVWRRFVLGSNEAADVLDFGQSIQLEASDTIKVVTTTSNVVDYVLTGVEES